MNLNGSDFRVGDNIIAELRLTNVGTDVVMLPWGIHTESVYGPNCEWPKTAGSTGLRGSVYLEVRRADGRGEIRLAVGLYGLSDDPKSYRDLVPGQSATIKISDPIRITPPNTAALGGGPRAGFRENVTVTAVFQLDNSSLRSPYEDLRSVNEIQITISEE